MPISSYFDQLQPASWRGIPFFVNGGDFAPGRRQAVHEYPNRDTVWVEDMGRATRRISFVGRLVGDDVIAQRGRLVAAIEASGPGTLIHPTLGRLTVSAFGPQPIRETERGRVFEISFTFLESGAAVFPQASVSTQIGVTTSALAMIQAAMGAAIATLQVAISQGSAVVQQIVSTLTGFCSQVSGLANDATNLFSMVQDLPGTASGIFGRYFGGGQVGFANISTPAPVAVPSTTVATLIATGAASRASVASAVTAMEAAAAGGNPTTIANAVQALVQALLASIVDPGTGLRLLESLYGYTQTPVLGSSAIPLAMASAQSACLELCRRATLQALAQTSAAYQPSSAEDAATVRTTVCGLILQEMVIAGDAGDDADYVALQALRVAVSLDLSSRGAALPELVTINTPAPIPALALAQRLYRDYSRAPQLIAFGDPPHPAFMPTSFQALSS